MTAPGRPHFDNPPVTEVRLSVSYDRLPRMRAAHVGLLWQALGGPQAYPEVEDLYAEQVVDEGFPAPQERLPFDFALLDRPRPSRTALRSRDRTDAVELQDDELTVIWSQQPGTQPYPRYEHVRQRFLRAIDLWSEVVQEHGLGTVKPRQAEIAYVNHLPAGQGWTDVADLPTVLNMQWMPTPGELVAEVPEDVHLYQRYILRRDDEPYGRLYVSADSDREHRGAKAVALSLTVRGRPREGTIRGTLDVLNEGHIIIVNTFVTVTSDRMHGYWGRRTS